MEAIQKQKCVYCKMNMTIDNFKKKRDDSYQKTCNQCLANRNASAKKRNKTYIYTCPHGKEKSKCRDCGGVSFCEHDRRRTICRDCGGGSVCEHNKERNKCKLCSDPLKITIKSMIQASKESDKKYDRYDVVNFVDYGFLENLLDDFSHCCYPDCNAELQTVHYQDDLATIESLDNSIGHIKSNCVICCMKCNKIKKSDHQ